MFWNSSASKSPHVATTTAAFGLIELLVSISIVMIVMSIVLARQDTFNSAVLLRNQAFDIALSLREAQLSAVSVQVIGGSDRQVIGVYFDTDATGAANQRFIVFRDGALATPDPSPNGFYNPSEDALVGQPRQLDPRFEIAEIRADGSIVSGGELSILFERPNFDARFFDAATSELSESVIEIDVKRVGVPVVAGDPGTVRTIEITETGQIAVQ